jgi:hypothetical protein
MSDKSVVLSLNEESFIYWKQVWRLLFWDKTRHLSILFNLSIHPCPCTVNTPIDCPPITHTHLSQCSWTLCEPNKPGKSLTSCWPNTRLTSHFAPLHLATGITPMFSCNRVGSPPPSLVSLPWIVKSWRHSASVNELNQGCCQRVKDGHIRKQNNVSTYSLMPWLIPFFPLTWKCLGIDFRQFKILAARDKRPHIK